MIIRSLSRVMHKEFRKVEKEERMRKRVKFWAFDSEFMMSGRAGAPEDVHTVQFSDGEFVCVLESADELKRWLYDHRGIRILYGFVILPDMGSLEEWNEKITVRTRGTQHIGLIKHHGSNIHVYDAKPLFSTFGMRKLEDVGKLVGVPKLPKPEWLGLRRWQTEEEHEEFKKYAAQDAVITSLGVKWLWNKCRADPMLHASAGSLARDEFQMPKRLKRTKNRVMLSPLEQMVKIHTFAGRSEGFITGFTPDVTYNDVKSLYPCSIVATRCLQIIGVEQCDVKDLEISGDLNNKRFGWIEGTFRTDKDYWGLPLRARNNIYVTGLVQGFYHTFDIAASKAEILNVTRAYRPIYSKNSRIHDKFADYSLKRIEKRLNVDESMLAKAVLNALSGKLGQSHPIAQTSNFYAYSTLLAHSHLIMSWLFDKCDSPIVAMDTDSIFTQSDMSGKYADLTDGNVTLPLTLESKGKGDLAFFRSKSYILKGKDDLVYGRHAWRYWTEDYLKLWSGDIDNLTTRCDIKHTLLTRELEALKMAKGRWRTKLVTLDLAKIKELLFADLKRKRADYDSYKLVRQRKNISSVAWQYEDLLFAQDNIVGYPKV